MIKWDVKKEDPIEFFDARLSYEISGYRPISDTEGLDFDPKKFTQTRDVYVHTGKYTQFHFGTKAYNDFWGEQYKRCRDGLTVDGYTITGDHYFFLNFYRLQDLTQAKKAGTGRPYTFPGFFVAQYEYFHYIDLCRVCKRDAIGLKARGVGFSEIGASLTVNSYSSRRETLSIIVAHKEQNVTKTLSKCWYQLNWLNNSTQGGFFKLRQIKDSVMAKKASWYVKKDGQDIEDGWMSEIDGITADTPGKIRGDRVDLLLYEESGSWPGWKKAFIQGEALVNIQGEKFGIKLAWGTGGDSGPALEGLSDAFYNPNTYEALPYRHCHTQSGEQVITAYFIPAYNIVNRGGYIDSRGYTNPIKGKEYYDKERAKKTSDPEAFLIYCAEYCYYPEEALALEGTNKFNKILLTDQLTGIKLLGRGMLIEHGLLEYTFNTKEHSKENINGFRWIQNNSGKIHILEHPIWGNNQDGKIRNLYVAGIDSIDLGMKDTSTATKDPSDFCITIKKRAYGNDEPRYVAYYKDRPNDIREAYKIAVRLLQYYNCLANLEASKVSIISWARDHGYINLFMKRPRATMPDVMHGKSSQYGSPATPAIIEHQTDLIADFVNDYTHTIFFPEMLDELIRYTDENKRKFDMVAAMGETELAEEELNGTVPKVVNVVNERFEDIGYYTDEYGIKHYGIIPKSSKLETRFNFNKPYENLGNRTSDPRYV